jgi:uncharacterized FAD-dependent dehydrogenase
MLPLQLLTLSLPPEIAFEEDRLRAAVLNKLRLNDVEDIFIRPLKRSIDARKKDIIVVVEVEVHFGSVPQLFTADYKYNDVSNSKPAIIVGAGPAGLFAALRLIELGIKPVIIERGKDVRERRRDLAAINKDHIVNPESNYCFGEGGAGTYSDGKLYTRSKKRGDLRRVLEILVKNGAKESILVDTHPHIGTNKLPALVSALRETILEYGGEIHFNTRMDDIILKDNQLKAIVTQNGDKIEGIGMILATGHSARDVFELLHKKNILIEAKPFAMGVRIEHRQSLIDNIQYHGTSRGKYLPASAYSLVSQVNYKGIEKGVFSFCMCPGGFIVPAATAPGEVVVNGMSPSKRDSKFANSGIVVSIDNNDLLPFKEYGPLAGLKMQSSLEQNAWIAGGRTQAAPAQRMMDFINNKQSANLLETSYMPGLTSAPMHEILPAEIRFRLQGAFKLFDNKMRGYLTNEAQIVGVESRTSSPVKIPRNPETLEHVHVKGLFPCGEGAGYAGGIVSAAMDGERCAEALVRQNL